MLRRRLDVCSSPRTGKDLPTQILPDIPIDSLMGKINKNILLYNILAESFEDSLSKLLKTTSKV